MQGEAGGWREGLSHPCAPWIARGEDMETTEEGGTLALSEGITHPGHTSPRGVLPQCPAFKMEAFLRARAEQRRPTLPTFWNPPTVSRAASEDRLP